MRLLGMGLPRLACSLVMRGRWMLKRCLYTCITKPEQSIPSLSVPPIRCGVPFQRSASKRSICSVFDGAKVSGRRFGLGVRGVQPVKPYAIAMIPKTIGVETFLSVSHRKTCPKKKLILIKNPLTHHNGEIKFYLIFFNFSNKS